MNNAIGHQYYVLDPILRMTLALTIFQFVCIIFMLPCPRSIVAETYHDGFWLFKFAFVTALWILLFSVPNNDLRIWLKAALFGCFLFCFLMLTGIVIGVLKLNMVFFRSSVNVRKRVHYLVYFINILTTFGIFVQFFIFIGGGSYNTVTENCGLNAMLIITTFAILGMTQGLQFRGDSSSFTKAALNLWFTFLLWNALAD